MTNTNTARSTTRQVRRVFIHVAGLPEAFTSTKAAEAWMAEHQDETMRADSERAKAVR